MSQISQISIHSPFEIPSDSTQFFNMGMTDEIESTYNMLETVYVCYLYGFLSSILK